MKLLADLASMIYPRVCCGCGLTLYKHEELICNLCYVSLPKTNYHLQNGNPVQKIFYGRADVPEAASFLFFEKGNRVRNMLHALKYKNKPGVGRLLGKWYGEEIKQTGAFADCEVIIPVPLHKKRLSKRGYNQSEHIAYGLGEAMGLPVITGVLLKKHFTETQTFKTREERWQNTMNSFEISPNNLIKGKNILLVDDVITTGATTEACIYQLHKCSERPVSVISLAYTP